MSSSARSSASHTFGSLPSRAATASESRSRPSAREAWLKIGRISAARAPCSSRRAWPRQSRRKSTVQRCQGKPMDLGDRRVQPLVGVGDRQLHAAEAPLHEPPQELAPEGLGLGLARRRGRSPRAGRTRARRGRSPGPCAAPGRRRGPSRPWRRARNRDSSLPAACRGKPRSARRGPPRSARPPTARSAGRATRPAGRPCGSTPRRRRPAAPRSGAPARIASSARGRRGSSRPGAASGSAGRSRWPGYPSASGDIRCGGSPDPGFGSPCPAPISSETSASIICWTTHRSDSRRRST